MNYIDQLFNLKDKVVVITGAGGHLCGAMARGFAQVGCKIVVLDLREEKAIKVAEEIKDLGGEATHGVIDVTQKSEFKKSLELTLNTYSQIDVLINGAGINAPTPILEISEKEWDNIMAAQLKSVLFGCQVFGEHMLKQRQGNIINISSASAGPPLSKAFTYSVAKAGTKNLTQNIAREWATKGIRVNAIRPGFFPTEWSQKKFIDADREKAILGHTAMKRYGNPNELIGAVLWLASDAASFVTGAEIAIDGGFSAMTI